MLSPEPVSPEVARDDEWRETGVSEGRDKLAKIQPPRRKRSQRGEAGAVCDASDLGGRGDNMMIVERGRVQHAPQGNGRARTDAGVLLLPR